MRIALAQINATLGDFSGNRIKIIEFAKRALEMKSDLVVFPEHALFGYMPNDLLERNSVVDEQLREFAQLEKEFPKGISGLVGCVTYIKSKSKRAPLTKHLYNSAAFISHGKKTRYFHKERLPAYDVFDESRHLAPGKLADGKIRFRSKSGVVNLQVSICEDIWGWGESENPMAKISRSGTDIVVNLSASPFTKSKRKSRLNVIKKTAEHFRAPVVYVNMVGAQDEVIFDGRSTVVDKKGSRLLDLAAFEEDLQVFDFNKMKADRTHVGSMTAKIDEINLVRNALIIGIRDFARKTGLKRCHFGLSGGIDSAVVACLAVDALGPENVTAVTMPGPFNDPMSRQWAEHLAKNLSIHCLNLPIESSYLELLRTLEANVGKTDFGIVHENLQARVRGVMLMAIANKNSSLLLSTGNKSEYACGYSTLYGDQCGGLAPLGDLLKREVYSLAKLYNLVEEIIPHEILDRAPSAELRPGQIDQDTLPPYDELDDAVEQVIENCRSARSQTEKFVLLGSYKSEFKRWQAPPILKVSTHAFGRGRRLPIAHRAKT